MTLPSQEQRWEVAKSKVSQLGSVPASFSSLIRKLRGDMQASPPVLSTAARFELNRLLRGPSLLTPLAFAALEFHPEKFTNVSNLPNAIIEAFSIEELCGLIGTLYLVRQVKKRCAEEEWNYVAESLVPCTTLAGHLGAVITPLSFERSMFSTAFIILGMALFQAGAAKEFASYRRHLKKAGKYFSIEEELKLFGCSCQEVGSLLSQTVALSSGLASEFLVGPETAPGTRPASGMQALNIWISSLTQKGTAPQEAMDAKWYPTRAKVEQIETVAKTIKEGSSKTGAWILKEAKDLDAIKSMLGSQGQIAAEIDEGIEPFEESA